MPPMKKDQEDMFKLYLDERFNNLHYQLNTLVKGQETSDVSIKELFHIIDTMREVDNSKCVKCENSTEIRTIRRDLDEIIVLDIKSVKKDITEVLFIKKYWKPFLIASVVMGLSMVIIADNTWSNFKSKYEVIVQKQEQQINNANKKIDTNTKVINKNSELLKKEQKENE
jgi:cell division protein FtsL